MKALRYYIPAILWVIFILFMCTLPGKDLPHESWMERVHMDKIVHFGLFGGIVFFLCLGYYWQKRAISPLTFFTFVLYAAMYGVLIEFIQKYFTVDRSFDMTDAAADTIGAIAGVWVFRLFRRWFLKPPAPSN
ncbi:MAG TPA: VanZ family protein [Chitinophaga sp.]|uniref:VanZ family protein n=1 Tax=Chitinophaga sp. TaxID=1869181 RepID=UPI002DB68585|nr:VanZ family protein [Chitinophaga sp.]HEU4553075.1 VanZ family protein [Chitinophaga sp.]